MRRALLAITLALACLPAHAEDAALSRCVLAASARYQVPADLVRAVMRAEGGAVGTVARNRNGSADLGVMQINTIHLPELARYGITRDMLVRDACLNIHVGTWILQRELSRGGDYWTNVGAYNSRTPVHNKRYRERVWQHLLAIWRGH